MAERADPVAPARAGRSLLPVLRRMAAMPLKDPFAFAGVLIYLLFALVALFAHQLAPVDPMDILFTKAGKLAANVPPGAAAAPPRPPGPPPAGAPPAPARGARGGAAPPDLAAAPPRPSACRVIL